MKNFGRDSAAARGNVPLASDVPETQPSSDILAFWKSYDKTRDNVGLIKAQDDPETIRMKTDIIRLSSKVETLEIENNDLKEIIEKQKIGLNDASSYEIARLKQLIDDMESKNKAHLDMISAMDEQQIVDQSAHDEETNELKTENDKLKRKIAQMERDLIDLPPVVIKKLFKLNYGNDWEACSTMDENEIPSKLSMDLNSNNLVIKGFVSYKKVILNGMLSQYEDDPFNNNSDGYFSDALIISHLLKKVHSCNLIDLFLCCQNLSWKECEILIASGTIKNLYFYHVSIKDGKAVNLQLENIIKPLQNIERFIIHPDMAAGGSCGVSKSTFKILNKLSPFEKLKEFKFFGLRHDHLDAYSFIDFMKKHRNAQFAVSFSSIGLTDAANLELEAMIQILESRAPHDKFEIINEV